MPITLAYVHCTSTPQSSIQCWAILPVFLHFYWFSWCFFFYTPSIIYKFPLSFLLSLSALTFISNFIEPAVLFWIINRSRRRKTTIWKKIYKLFAWLTSLKGDNLLYLNGGGKHVLLHVLFFSSFFMRLRRFNIPRRSVMPYWNAIFSYSDGGAFRRISQTSTSGWDSSFPSFLQRKET